MLTSLKSIRRAADHWHVIRILALAGILAMTAAAEHRSAPRSERRDQTQAQRGRTKAPSRSSAARRHTRHSDRANNPQLFSAHGLSISGWTDRLWQLSRHNDAGY